jgi:hypothetical protein
MLWRSRSKKRRFSTGVGMFPAETLKRREIVADEWVVGQLPVTPTGSWAGWRHFGKSLESDQALFGAQHLARVYSHRVDRQWQHDQ